jgi:hypothetical protein
MGIRSTAKLSILSLSSEEEKEKEEEEGVDFMLTDKGAKSRYAVTTVLSSSPSLPSFNSNTMELPVCHENYSKQLLLGDGFLSTCISK